MYHETGSLIRSDAPPVDGWRAWHVFLYDFEEQDEFLREVITPLIYEFIAEQSDTFRWFYIRFWEQGPHLRLRFRHLNRRSFDSIGERLHAEALRFAKTTISRSRNDVLSQPNQLDDRLALLPAGTVAEIAYEPEIRRYGGCHCIRGCEDAFGQSSAIALQFLGNKQAGDRTRRGLGLLMSALGAALATADESEMAGIFAATCATWSHYLGDMVPAMPSAANHSEQARDIGDRILALALAAREGHLPTDPLAAKWMQLLISERARMESLHRAGVLIVPATGNVTQTENECRGAITSVFLSHSHMMMNRLGITPLLEYHYAALLKEALAGRGRR